MADRGTRKKVAVLGATGAVGQRFVQLLEGHPWFELAEVAASDRSAGKVYGEGTPWLLPGGVPRGARELEILPADPAHVKSDLVFSALDASAAGPLEGRFRSSGATVVSNASCFRGDPEVPLVIPEINPGHLSMIGTQRERHGGAIVTNPNCSSIGLCLALEPLRLAFGLKRVQVTTLQAISGAGYPGVPSLDLLDNVLPSIAGEEEKLQTEPGKVFGEIRGERVDVAPVTVSAQCNRVAVRDGHLLSISVELARTARVEEAADAYEAFRSPLVALGLPSAPERPIVLNRWPARPQPLLDRDTAGGMAVTVGRLMPCPVLGLRMVALVHNTIRGAAGGTLLIGELLVAKRLV